MRPIHHPDAEAELIEASSTSDEFPPSARSFLTPPTEPSASFRRRLSVGVSLRQRSAITSCRVFLTLSTTASCRTIFASLRSSTTAVTRTTGVTVSPNRPRTPNHALQPTAPAVTACAADRRHLSAHRHRPRQPPPWLSLGSLGDAERFHEAQPRRRLARPVPVGGKVAVVCRTGRDSRSRWLQRMVRRCGHSDSSVVIAWESVA